MRGRKRNIRAKRYKNGQIKKDADIPNKYLQIKKQALLPKDIRPQDDHLAENTLGLLYAWHYIDKRQYEAGELYRTYYLDTFRYASHTTINYEAFLKVKAPSKDASHIMLFEEQKQTGFYLRLRLLNKIEQELKTVHPDCFHLIKNLCVFDKPPKNKMILCLTGLNKLADMLL